MGITHTDLDKRIYATFGAANANYREMLNADTTTVNIDELETLKRKAGLFDVLMAASRREIESMYDFMQASGARGEVLLLELARLQRMRGAR